LHIWDVKKQVTSMLLEGEESRDVPRYYAFGRYLPV
jgi:hypothetical protein